MIIPKEAIEYFKRQCEHKRLEVLCGLLKEGDRVLDVGCGIGTYTSIPLSYLPIKIKAIDSDSATIRYAKERNTRQNLEFVCASGEYFDSDERYDLIVCSHILEHLYNPAILLANMRRLLKDGGMLYVAIPNGFGCFEIQNFVPRMMCKTDWGRSIIYGMMGNKVKDTLNVDSQHVHFYTIGGMRRLLRDKKWRIERQISEAFLGGIVFDRLLPRIPLLDRWNVKVASRMPMQLTNSWIFICKKSF